MLYLLLYIQLIFIILILFLIVVYSFLKNKIDQIKKFVFIMVVGIIIFGTISYSISILSLYGKEEITYGSFPFDDEHEFEIKEESTVQLFFTLSAGGYSDTDVSCEVKVYNPQNELIHTYNSKYFVDINEHQGGGEVKDSTIFYCTQKGKYHIKFDTEQTEKWGDDPIAGNVRIFRIPLSADIVLDILVVISFLCEIIVFKKMFVNHYKEFKDEIRLYWLKEKFLRKKDREREGLRIMINRRRSTIFLGVINCLLPWIIVLLGLHICLMWASWLIIVKWYPFIYLFYSFFMFCPLIGLVLIVLKRYRTASLFCLLGAFPMLPLGILGLIVARKSLRLAEYEFPL